MIGRLLVLVPRGALAIAGPLSFILAAVLTFPAPAQADDSNVPVSSIAVQRLDPTVTRTTIRTSFATAHDVVEVYNYVPVAASADWRLATSMDDATWLFRPGGGAPKLAIFFSTAGGQHTAVFGVALMPIRHWAGRSATVLPCARGRSCYVWVR